MTLDVRRVRADEGPLLKQVRLAALADAPGAFASSYDDEAAFDDAVWEQRAVRGADGDGGTGTFLLVGAGGTGASPLGIAIGRRPGPGSNRVELVSMWVAPAARRAGSGRLLVDAVAGWAEATGASTVDLWVMRANHGAQAFYEHLGFAVTDDIEVDADDPCRDEIRMTRPLAPSDAGDQVERSENR